MEPKFRLLRADEIDVRIGNTNRDKTKANLLLYKDARCDMNVLDETVGPLNWQRSHNRDNANCVVSIWDDDKRQWISKEDTGTESKTEAEKGLASDSFKRACFNWGIGRELYSAPSIWVPYDKDKYESYTVAEIGYNEKREISKLAIANKAGSIIFRFGSTTAKNEPPKVEPAPDDVQPVKKQENKKPEEPPIPCEMCGNPVQSMTIGDGKVVPPAQVAQITREKYNACLCSACAYKVKQSLEKRKTA